jgi:hypothetical protein
MKPTIRLRFWFESGLSAISGGLALVTLFSQDWIEAITGFDPDQHDGSVEWILVGLFIVLSIVLAMFGRKEWRRSRLPLPA